MPELDSMIDEVIFRNQTAILRWLFERGHVVDDKFYPIVRVSKPRLAQAPRKATPHYMQHPRNSHRAVGKPCPYCKEKMEWNVGKHPTKDHIQPKSKNGRIKIWCCWTCNARKGNMTLNNWREHCKLSAAEMAMTFDQWKAYLEGHDLVIRYIPMLPRRGGTNADV